MKLTTPRTLLVGAGLLAVTCHAAPIVYEGFDYVNGAALNSVNGGTGWLAPWTGANYGAGPSSSQQELVITNGYNWTNSTGGYIVGVGGSAFDRDSSAHGSYRQWFTPSADETGFTNTYGNTIWFSFLATYDAASGSGCSVCPFQVNTDPVIGFGARVIGPSGNGDFQLSMRVGNFGEAPDPAAWAAFGITGSSQRTIAACQPGTNLVVGRFTLGGGPSGPAVPFTGTDRLDVWLNPNSDPGTNSGLVWISGFYTYRSTAYSSGYLGIRTGGGGQMTTDEIRIGTSYADVVPATATSPAQVPSSPALTIEPAGGQGLQISASDATPTNSSSIGTYYTTNAAGTPTPIDASWVGKAPAAYSFTIAKPPANGPTNFMAHAWLVPFPNGHIQALDNLHAMQLALISDGNGGAKAVLGYYVNGSSSVQENLQTMMTTGVICTIPNAPFAGTWTIVANSDTSFTVFAPNGASASGSMQSGDEANFASSVSFYIGVSPNGASNVGTPALGRYMTVSSVSITNNSGVTINPAWGPGGVLQSSFTAGQSLGALNPPNWQVLSTAPSCIYVMPGSSVYRATWGNACGTSAAANILTRNNNLTAGSPWGSSVPTTTLLSDSTNVAFITTSHLSSSNTFFRVRVPYVP